MTSLLEVATHVPPDSVDVVAHLNRFQLTDEAPLYARYYGFGRIRRSPDESIVDQLLSATDGLRELRGRADDVRYVVHGLTIQPTAPYPEIPVVTVCRRLGLHNALPFSLSQHACASPLLAIDICGRLLVADGDPDGLALILAGEKTITSVAQFMPHAAVLGEGVAAILVRAGGQHDRLLGYASRTLGRFHEAPDLPPKQEAEFHATYVSTLTAVLREALAQSGLAVADVALLLPHNINRISWLRVIRELGLPRERLYLDNQAVLGHCFGADPFIGLCDADAAGRLGAGDHYVLTAVGLGATFAAMVFRR